MLTKNNYLKYLNSCFLKSENDSCFIYFYQTEVFGLK